MSRISFGEAFFVLTDLFNFLSNSIRKVLLSSPFKDMETEAQTGYVIVPRSDTWQVVVPYTRASESMLSATASWGGCNTQNFQSCKGLQGEKGGGRYRSQELKDAR